jgi:hypothetical protein
MLTVRRTLLQYIEGLTWFLALGTLRSSTMRRLRYTGRRGGAAILVGAALLGSAAACSSSGSPAPSATSASPGTTTAASAQAGPLAGLSADQIARRAIDDFKTVSSVHVTGTVKDTGQNIALNLTLGTQGCTGTMGTNDEGSFVLLKIGKTLWIKPDDRFWKKTAGSDADSVMDLVSGKYIKTSAKGSSLASIGAICDPAQFAKSFGQDMTGMAKGTTTTIAGQPALQIKDTADSASAYVTVSAHPQFLRLDGGGGNGKLDFTRYNAPLHLSPPPSAKVLDGADFGF